MESFAQQESGHGRALLGEAEMEVLDAVEFATAPLGIDLARLHEDAAFLRIGEGSARDAGDARRKEALDIGRREVAASSAQSSDVIIGTPP